MLNVRETNDPVFLMCAPDFYAVAGPDENGNFANRKEQKAYKEYMNDPVAFRKEAEKQWTEYHAHLESLGVSIVQLEPKEGIGDLVYTADPTLSLITCSNDEANRADQRAITISSRFSNTGRQPEVEANVGFIEKFDPSRGILSAHFNTEGTGDNFYDPYRDVYWSGFVDDPSSKKAVEGRSDIRSHRGLQSLTGVPVNSMGTKDPFFHIDTSMTPLSRGHIVAFKDGMRPEAFDTLLREGFERYGMDPEEYLILVDEKDADAYACNLRCIDNTIIMPLVSEGLQERLRDKGYEVITQDIHKFIQTGGAMHCLTNNLNERRVLGGTCVNYGYERKPSI